MRRMCSVLLYFSVSMISICGILSICGGCRSNTEYRYHDCEHLAEFPVQVASHVPGTVTMYRFLNEGDIGTANLMLEDWLDLPRLNPHFHCARGILSR